MRAESHLFAPQRERTTRTEMITGGRPDRLVWIATPAHGLDQLRAGPEESPLGSTGQSEREQSAGHVAVHPCRRKHTAQPRSGERPEPFLLLDPRGDLLDERRRRRVATRHDL